MKLRALLARPKPAPARAAELDPEAYEAEQRANFQRTQDFWADACAGRIEGVRVLRDDYGLLRPVETDREAGQ